MRRGTIGILPVGALGVGFLFHLTRELTEISDQQVVFLERQGSRSAQALRQAGEIVVAAADRIYQLPTQTLLKPDLVTCHQSGELPEVVLICPNPDQILGVITTVVQVVEQISVQGDLEAEDLPLPLLVLCANGIYFQQVRQVLIEKLEESTLFGRLPDLWPELMPRIVCRLLRGVTIQTGVRRGSGQATIYYPGPRGLTRLAGGSEGTRQRCHQILTERGGWFEIATGSTPTRLEFDKALVNLSCNLLGQIYAIDASGSFRSLTVGQILTPEHEMEVRQLIYQVLQVGRAVRAYGSEETEEQLYEQLTQIAAAHEDHIPSSLQWVELQLRQGMLRPQITPTEAWLLDPMVRYGLSAGLDHSARYFESLKQRLEYRLGLAVDRELQASGGGY